MLAELAAINAAYGTIRAFVSNGQELSEAAGAMTNYFNSKSTLARKAKRSGTKSQFEAFLAMQKVKEEETKLKEFLIYECARPELWTAFLQFQKDAKRLRIEQYRKRQAAIRERNKRTAKIMKGVSAGITLVTTTLLMSVYAVR